MKRYLFSIVIALFGVAIISASGGDLQVSGEVTGIWPAGETIQVEGPIWVPANGNLMIEEGVVIYINITDPFLVWGGFSAIGTADYPIQLIAPDGWQGIHFKDLISEVRALEYVNLDESSGLPDTVIYADNASLRISYCQFRGLKRCLAVAGGWLQANNNIFESVGLLSTAVHLDSLEDDVIDGCGGEGNSLQNNIIRVTVPETEAPIDPRDRQTIGLLIQRFYHICLTGNIISVSGPRDVDGVQFREAPHDGSGFWNLIQCVVTTQSSRGQARGVVNKTEGQLWIQQCTVDVSRTLATNLRRPLGVYVEGHATTLVTTTVVQVDVGELFYNSSSQGRIDVDYAVEWRSKGQLFSLPIDPGLSARSHIGLNSTTDAGTVTFGEHVQYADPQFMLIGDWGHWNSMAEAADYYGLRPGSPCIDSGEVEHCGYDPDNTLPDIGSFFYDQNLATPTLPVSTPSVFALNAPYPNPFNSVTVIPLQVNRSGMVKVSVYNVLGRKVTTLTEAHYQAGSHTLLFQPDNLSAGLYYIVASFNGSRELAKSVLYIK